MGTQSEASSTERMVLARLLLTRLHDIIASKHASESIVIDISIEDDVIKVGQRVTPPSVYLDHWALLDFSEDEKLGTRLTEAIEARNGTLTLSWLNLLEYSKITDELQARKAEGLFERNMPRLFFIDIQPFRVISREDAFLSGGPKVPPHGNDALLREFASMKPASPTSVHPFSTNNLFRYSQDAEFASRYEVLADTAINRIEAMREEVSTDPSFESIVRRLPSGPAIEAGTRYVIRELLRTMLLNKEMKITRNHAIDLLHAVVPVSYCDFVLLDRNWEAQVAQMRTRVSASGMSFPIAKVFSRKANGVERFLNELDAK